MATPDLALIKNYENTLGGIKELAADHVAGAIPQLIASVPGLGLLGASAVQDIQNTFVTFGKGATKGVLETAENQKVGNQTIGDMIGEAIRSFVAMIYEKFGASDQYKAGETVLKSLSNGDSQLDEGLSAFHSSLPKNLQPSEKLLSGFVAAGIMDATQSFSAIGSDMMGKVVGTGFNAAGAGKAFNAAKASSEHIGNKVYDSVYSGMLAHYVNQGISEDNARVYAASVAQEASGMQLALGDNGKPQLVAGENGGVRKYFEQVIDAGRTGADIKNITLEASTPEALIVLKRADAALESKPSTEKDGQHVDNGTQVTSNVPPKKPEAAQVAAK